MSLAPIGHFSVTSKSNGKKEFKEVRCNALIFLLIYSP